MKKKRKTMHCYLPLVQIIFLLIPCFRTFAQDDEIKYETQDGISYSIKQAWDRSRKIHFQDHASNIQLVDDDEDFNRGVRRGNTILVTGDRPGFAMMKISQENKLDPDLIKLGDGRIRIKNAKDTVWFDLLQNIKTIFYPGYTEYEGSFSSFPGLKTLLTVSQAAGWGILVKLSLSNTSDKPLNIDADMVYGGLRKCSRTVRARYFTRQDDDGKDNFIQSLQKAVLLASKDIQDSVYVTTFPFVTPMIDQGKIIFSHKMSLNPKDKMTVYLVVGHGKQADGIREKVLKSNPDKLITEAKFFYDSLLTEYHISTPDKVLDAGFRTAVLNLDYIYADKAWLEGVHWWGAYWTNNYQISAAISLDQIDRAKRALRFFNSSQYGPAPVMTASGEPDERIKSGEDGVLYFTYELLQYYDHTGDRSLLTEVWPKLKESLDLLLKERDPDVNGLINWRLGANSFMYQADHLGMPGDAASPSLIMAGMLERLSLLGTELGQSVDAERWKIRSNLMYANLNKILWNKEAGVFYGHKDLQGISHMGHYYTDMVFPVLYTNLPDQIGWQSLDYLYRTLWRKNYKGEKSLMQVGDYKPSVFGGDNVMPTQMAEAARAYFKIGDNDKGVKLLSSVALASTVYTEAPGSFPERMDDVGKGEGNFLFGNPIGSYIYSIISGLFGLQLSEGGKRLDWSPAFPEKWEHADFRVPYATISYKKIHDQNVIHDQYKVIHNQNRALSFSVFIDPCRLKSVLCNGKKINYKPSYGEGRTKLKIQADPAGSHTIMLEYEPVDIKPVYTEKINQDDAFKFSINVNIDSILDPQNVLKNIKITGNGFEARVENKPGFHQVYIKLKDIPVFVPVTFEIAEFMPVRFILATYDYEKQKIVVKLKIRSSSIDPSSRLMVGFNKYIKSISLNKGESAGFDTTLVFNNIKLIPEGTYLVNYSIERKGKVIFNDSGSVTISGVNRATSDLMRSTRDRNSEQLDLSKWYNTDEIKAHSYWRNKNVKIDHNYFTGVVNDTLKTSSGNFKMPMSGLTMAMISYGKSERDTRETKKGTYPDTMVFPISKKVQSLSLLYVNEIETRLTGARIGSIELLYENGKKSVIPLVVGRNVDALARPFATDVVPVKLIGDDYAKAYSMACDPSEKLKSVLIRIEAADVDFGLIALNMVLDK